MIPEHLRNELPGYLRELQANLAKVKNVPGQLRQAPAHLREVPSHLRDVPALARNLTRDQRHSAVAISGAAAAAVALTLVPTSSSAQDSAVVADGPANSAVLSQGVHGQLDEVREQQEHAAAGAEKAAEAKAQEREKQAAADRSKRQAAPKKAEQAPKAAKKAPAKATKAAEAPQQYPNNLDGWIREAMSIMDKHDIPGSYDRIKWNIMRESSGDPNAINNWDINARNGVPSIGLLQVIKPTFDAYHVEGTAHDQYDPVANIVAACNYAADRYGSIDHVWSAY
ncbi:transglycosylase SLT domain-containing protein [Streptomyces sp. JJ66]|nr:transglycosylase SLT domain-containing protein [Streptomyces sp. JJ66]